MRDVILSSTGWVVERSKHVKIKEGNVSTLLDKYVDRLGKKHPEEKELFPFLQDNELAEWLFVVEILNHCFWPDPGKPRWEIEYKGKWYSGYWALEASLLRALQQYRMPVHKAEFLAGLNTEDLKNIFSGRGEIPLFKERLENLKEAGEILLERWEGSITNVIEEAGGSALKLVELLKDNFWSFKDEAKYLGNKVYFYKRAQIFPADLHAKLGGKSWGRFRDVNMLTAFADYKLPQVLRHLGIMEYDSYLAGKIDSFQFLTAGSEEEIEIRAATIQACELIRRKAQTEKGLQLTSLDVDQWLWSLGQENAFRRYPYHRTRTIYY